MADLRAQDWDRLVADSGISESNSGRQRTSTRIHGHHLLGHGLTQHENGIANIQSVVNLLSEGTSADREQAPVRYADTRTSGRPHDGDLGGAVGGLPRPAGEGHGFLLRDITASRWSRPSERCIAVRCLHRPWRQFLSAAPDTEYTADALRRCDLTVQISTKLNRSHLITGKEAFILPCLGRTEVDTQASGVQFVTVENSMGVVHRSRGGLPPASPHLRSEPSIVAALAQALPGVLLRLGRLGGGLRPHPRPHRGVHRRVRTTTPGSASAAVSRC